jgi:predicted PurR-regulated permease PerM
MLSYLCKPLVHAASLKGISRKISAIMIVSSLLLFLVIGFKLIEKSLPTGVERVEKQIRIQYHLNRHASEIFAVTNNEKSQGSFLYQYFHSEIDEVMKSINSVLSPTSTENENFQILLKARADANSTRVLNMLLANNARTFWIPEASEFTDLNSHMPHFTVSQLTVWLLFPIVFLFLLLDDGGLSRFIVRLIPNSYFELSLTLMERVDRALGHYLRGTAMECAAVGMVTSFILLIFGIDLTGALMIGLIAGILNAIPFLGMLVGLAIGIVYAIMQESATPWLPFLTQDHLVIGVFVAIGTAHVLDNALFQPLLLGRAVNLHPLAVIISVAASGMAFGFLGMLLAIPFVVTAKVCFETVSTGLRDYNLI